MAARDYPEYYRTPERPEREAFCERCGSDHPSEWVAGCHLCAACAVRVAPVLHDIDAIGVALKLVHPDPERRARMEADLRAVERMAASLRGRR